MLQRGLDARPRVFHARLRHRAFAQDATAFWVAANLAGLCMGSSQAAGRAVVGYLAPPARLAEFFGLWGLAVKAASIFGPLTYGAVTWIFAGNHRLGIFVTGLYFVVGLLLLRKIDVDRGRLAALADPALDDASRLGH